MQRAHTVTVVPCNASYTVASNWQPKLEANYPVPEADHKPAALNRLPDPRTSASNAEEETAAGMLKNQI